MSTKIEILPYADVPQTLHDEFETWYTQVFSEEIATVKGWSEPAWMLITYEDDVWVNIAELHLRQITVGGQALLVGGIGGVFTLPEQRKKGYTSAMMQQAVDFLCGQGAAFNLLVCRGNRIPLYERMGWRVVTNPAVFSQPTGTTQTQAKMFTTMIYPCTDQDWFEGEINYNGLPW